MKKGFGTHNPIVIIGGGVSGLAAGAFLAKNGLDVQLFEANNKLGGCSASTVVNGYTFNDGALFLAVVEILDDVFARLGLCLRELLPLRKVAANLSATLPDGTFVTLGEGLELRVEGRSIDEKKVRRELQAMMERWEPVLRLISEHLVPHPFSPWRILRKGWRHVQKFRGNLASEMYRLFTDDAVRTALAGALLYTGLPPERAPVSTILGLVAMISGGIYLPEGGMGRIPQLLGAALENHGGKMFLNSKVKRIIIEDGHVCGVEVPEQGRVDAAAVISTASPMLTYASLLDPEQIPSRTKRKLRRTRLSHRAVSLQFGLRNLIRIPSYLNMVLPSMERQREIFTQDAETLTWLSYCVPTLISPELAPAGGSIVELFLPVPDEVPLEDWDHAKKERVTESAIRALRRMHDMDIAATRVRSPKDFVQDLQLYQGALYGLPPSTGPWEQFAHASPIRDLFLAGQCTYPGYGVATSAMSGIFAAQQLLDGAAS